MLSSFTAQNFRQFTKLDLPKLGQVNLFVGRNNAGKSALLEAIEVYVTNASYQTLLEILSAREETWGGNSASNDLPVGGEVFRHLFRGHKLPTLDVAGIVIGPLLEPAQQLQLTTAFYQTTTQEDGLVQRMKIDAAQMLDAPEDVEMHLVSVENGETRRIIDLNTPNKYNRASSRIGFANRMPIQVVPTRNIQPAKVAALWDSVGLTDLEQEVIKGLQLIEAGITGVAFVKSSGPHEKPWVREDRVPLARMMGQKEPLPLRSMGDGLTRLFHITLALVNAKNGVLLIDEFENGLHWSVQEQVWTTVFTLAKRLNVQIFATTHSRDCVQAFEAAWEKHPQQGAYYRLEGNAEGEVRARSYSLETLSDSIETDVETR